MAVKDYKDEYLEEKFKGLGNEVASLVTLINARFKNVDEQLDRVEKHAENTNSRVNHAEEDIVLVNKRLDDALTFVRHYIDVHPQSCPNAEIITSTKKEIKTFKDEVDGKFDALKSRLEDVFFVTKYPKLFLAGIVVAVLMSLLTLISNNPFSIFDKDKSTVQVENINQ